MFIYEPENGPDHQVYLYNLSPLDQIDTPGDASNQ